MKLKSSNKTLMQTLEWQKRKLKSLSSSIANHYKHQDQLFLVNKEAKKIRDSNEKLKSKEGLLMKYVNMKNVMVISLVKVQKLLNK